MVNKLPVKAEKEANLSSIKTAKVKATELQLLEEEMLRKQLAFKDF